MSEFTTSNGITIKINEDGSITQIGSWDYKIGKSSIYPSRPQIAKMYLSNEHLTCGETVQFSWSIIDGEDNTLIIEQGGYETMYNIPAVGEINISSDIISDDIYLTVGSKNDYGEVNARKTLRVAKRRNDVKASKSASVIYAIIAIFIFISLIIRVINI
jgi:hypothetical protein